MRPREMPPQLPQRLFQRYGRSDVDLDQHAGPSELVDSQQSVGGHRYRSECLLPAFAEIRLVSDVGQVGHHLHDVAERASVLFERALDLVERILALRREVPLVEDVSAFAVFILGADAGEKYHLAGTDERHSFGKSAFGPFAVCVVFLLEGLRRRGSRHEQGRKRSKGQQFSHVTTSLTEQSSRAYGSGSWMTRIVAYRVDSWEAAGDFAAMLRGRLAFRRSARDASPK